LYNSSNGDTLALSEYISITPAAMSEYMAKNMRGFVIDYQDDLWRYYKNYDDFAINVPLKTSFRCYEDYVKHFINRVAAYRKMSTREVLAELTKTE
jgi:hypothetical protein